MRALDKAVMCLRLTSVVRERAESKCVKGKAQGRQAHKGLSARV